MAQWYYSRGDQRYGPISQEQLQALAGTGELRASDLVWAEGMETWLQARLVKCLGPFAPPEPPPMPSRVEQGAAEIERLIKSARLHLAQGAFEEAVAQTNEVIGLDGKQASAYLIRAEAHRRLKRTERALADLAVAIRLAPDRPEPYLVRASILKKQLRLDQAIADATQALILNPGLTAAYALRSECRRLIGDEDGARQDAEELIRLDPTHPLGNRLNQPSESPVRSFSLEEELLDPGVPLRRGDGSDLFADGRPAERSLKLRQPVRSSRTSSEDASDAERLADAVDYRPEVMTTPLPRIRGRQRQNSARWTPALVLLLAGLVGVLWMQKNRQPQPSPSVQTRIPPAGVPVAAAPALAPSSPPVATTPVAPNPGSGTVRDQPESVIESVERLEPTEDGLLMLRGTWLAVEEVVDGKRVSGEALKSRQKSLKVVGNQFSLAAPSSRIVGTIRAVPEEGMQAVDLEGKYVEGGDGKSIILRGIYEITGQSMRFCYTASDDRQLNDRPKSFEAGGPCVTFTRTGPRPLLPGPDLSGWTVFSKNKDVRPHEDFDLTTPGVLTVLGQNESYIRTDEVYQDFVLRFEWRFPQGSRQSGSGSGLLLGLGAEDAWLKYGFEVQIATDRSGELWIYDRWGFAGQQRQGQFGHVPKRGVAEKSIGQWNTYEIRCQGPKITVKLNGQLVNEAIRQRPIVGRLGFISQGAEVEIRELWLTPLEP